MISDLSHCCEQGRVSNIALLNELDRLVDAGKIGDLDMVLSADGVDHGNKEAVNRINSAIQNYFTSTEYSLMKYRLTSEVLCIALWEMDVSLNDPINLDNEIIWSHEVRQMLGFSDEHEFPNVLGSWIDRLHPDDKDGAVEAVLMHLFDYSGKTVFDVEYRIKHKSGEYRYIHAYGTSQRDSTGVPLRFAGAMRDIEDVKQTQSQLMSMANELKTALLNLQEANHVKKELLSRISHEMLTPLNAITGMAQIVMQSGIPESVERYMHIINDASSKLLIMINNLFDFSRGEDEGFKLQESEFSFEKMFRDSSKAVQQSLIQKRHSFRHEIDPSIQKSLLGDKNRLSQVIIHLLENAAKFTPPGGDIRFFANLLFEDHDSVILQIEVVDNGIGISREQQSRIFDVFSQVDESTTRNYGGIGLGLPLAKYIIGLMDGDIAVHSDIGEGSIFSFTCKLKKSGTR